VRRQQVVAGAMPGARSVRSTMAGPDPPWPGLEPLDPPWPGSDLADPPWPAREGGGERALGGSGRAGSPEEVAVGERARREGARRGRGRERGREWEVEDDTMRMRHGLVWRWPCCLRFGAIKRQVGGRAVERGCAEGACVWLDQRTHVRKEVFTFIYI
jgi:hypothetical protein